MPPREAWAPELTQSLAEPRREIEGDGWVVSGRGDQPWDLHFRRRDPPRSGGSPDTTAYTVEDPTG